MTFIPPADWMMPVLGLETVVVVLAFGLGATVGSFLNVVVHRAPRRESVVGGRSYCPACGSRVRARDNIPIVGWLLLHGRCRDCRRPIPARYPLVEAVCGIILAALALTQIMGSGRGATQPNAAVDRVVMRGDWQPLLAWLDHAAILLTLVAWAELARRGAAVSRSATGLAVVGVLSAAVLVPGVTVPGILGTPAGEQPGSGPLDRLASALLGGAVGWVVGKVAASPSLERGALLVGAASGWQGVAIATTLTLACRAMRRSAGIPPGDDPKPDLVGWDLVLAAAIQFVCTPDAAAPFRAAVRMVLGS